MFCGGAIRETANSHRRKMLKQSNRLCVAWAVPALLLAICTLSIEPVDAMLKSDKKRYRCEQPLARCSRHSSPTQARQFGRGCSAGAFRTALGGGGQYGRGCPAGLCGGWLESWRCNRSRDVLVVRTLARKSTRVLTSRPLHGGYSEEVKEIFDHAYGAYMVRPLVLVCCYFCGHYFCCDIRDRCGSPNCSHSDHLVAWRPGCPASIHEACVIDGSGDGGVCDRRFPSTWLAAHLTMHRRPTRIQPTN